MADAKVVKGVRLTVQMHNLEKKLEALKEEKYKLTRSSSPEQITEVLRQTQNIWNK